MITVAATAKQLEIDQKPGNQIGKNHRKQRKQLNERLESPPTVPIGVWQESEKELFPRNFLSVLSFRAWSFEQCEFLKL